VLPQEGYGPLHSGDGVCLCCGGRQEALPRTGAATLPGTPHLWYAPLPYSPAAINAQSVIGGPCTAYTTGPCTCMRACVRACVRADRACVRADRAPPRTPPLARTSRRLQGRCPPARAQVAPDAVRSGGGPRRAPRPCQHGAVAAHPACPAGLPACLPRSRVPQRPQAAPPRRGADFCPSAPVCRVRAR
jgi:hypothetical protein